MLHARRAAAAGRGPATRRRSSSGRSCSPPSCSPSPASSSSCRSTGWRRSSSSTCPTRSATAGREDALAFLRETLAAKPDGDVAGIVAFGERRARRAAAVRARGDRPDRLDAGQVARPTSAPRCASPTALFPDDAQKRIVLLSDGNDTTGAGQAEAALAAARGVQIETRADRPRAAPTRSSSSGSRRRRRRASARRSRSIAEIRSTVAQPATVRLFADGDAGRHAAGRPRRRHDARDLRRHADRGRASTPSGSSSRPARDTFSQNDRADSNTIVKGEPRILVAGRRRRRSRPSSSPRSRAERQQVDTVVPEALPDRPRRPRRPTTASSSSTCRGSACRTASWPRSRSTSATSARAWS